MTDKTNELVLYAIASKEAIKLMGGNRGKMTNQAGHAYLHAFWDAEEHFPAVAAAYKNQPGAVKVTLAVETTAELGDLFDKLAGTCGLSLVTDAARTVFTEPTTTYLGVGPITRAGLEAIAPGLRPLL